MTYDLTPRQEIVLAALAAERGAEFAPVQVQKLFFLLDENIPAEISGPHFSFEPYDYGPFDSAVYGELEALAHRGLVTVRQTGVPARRRGYALTVEGQELGERALTRIIQCAPMARFTSGGRIHPDSCR